MLNIKFHVFGSATTATSVFGRSRDFTFEPVIASIMENALGLPPQDQHWFHPPLEKRPKELESEEPDPRVFVESNLRIWTKYLSGRWLNLTVDVYLASFVSALDRVLNLSRFSDGNWLALDLHGFMSRIVFETSARTFFGPRLEEIWGPTMWEDYKAFGDVAYVGVRTDLIFRLNPRAGRARDRMLKAFERWADIELEDWDETDGVWNEKWGVRLNCEKEEMARKLGFSLRGRASVHASFLFAWVFRISSLIPPYPKIASVSN